MNNLAFVSDYLQKINLRYQTGFSQEHSYRGDLQNLLELMVPDVLVTNEPTRIKCGAPDYILTRANIPVGYIEAKDIGADLNSKMYREQLDRYRKSIDNLTVTDYLKFYFYKEGDFVSSVTIAEPALKTIRPLPEAFEHFNNLIKDFATTPGQTITSAKKLAKLMAGKARLMANIIESALNNDEVSFENTALREQMLAFKEILIHDITNKDFADIYSQTIAYGMFAARLHDHTLSDFNRHEAAELIPRSNPFLRKLFQYIAGYDLDYRINWTVDALADIFRATDVKFLLKDFGKATQQHDPMIHFYETFLSEYDPKLRKSRGVWYTPEPVVNFMVRAVDDILKTEFELKDGLATIDKTKIKVKSQNADKRTSTGYRLEEKEVHKVQILDPATGTGTYLAQIIKHIHSSRFGSMQGAWSKYVEDHLIPRLNGFEILMASYAMAHLKLDMLLSETGYKPTREQRLRIYLTNSLEEHHPDTGTLFANWLSTEANEANHIKRDTPVMCIIGNPPYSGISSNNGEWIRSLIEDYKYIDGVHFEERKHWLNDDYVKFLRFGQYFIEKNGTGVLAFINPHGFLDNPTFRGMRWNLLKTYDKIYTIDLHGNSNKKETGPGGSIDQNVFDILQGVSVNIFVKSGQKKPAELGEVFHFDLFGKRGLKYDFLSEHSLEKINFSKIKYQKPFYFFVPKNDVGKQQYEKGFRVNALFPSNVTGIVTARDSVVIDMDKEKLIERIKAFTNDSFSDREIRNLLFPTKQDGKYLAGDSRGWKLELARKKIANNKHDEFVRDIDYRPFDSRKIYYSPHMVDWGREKMMQNFINMDNIGLNLCRQLVSENYSHVFITNKLVDDSYVSNKSRERGYVFPLYIWPETKGQLTIEQKTQMKVNLNMEIVSEIAEKLQLTYIEKKESRSAIASQDNSIEPIDLMDYVYAVLHSPNYREKYKEFLKIDFPRVPYPKDQTTFWQLVKLGGEMRHIHLLESATVEQYITKYPIDGDNLVGKPKYKDGKAYINDTQYFDGVPQIAWEFYIGGYQPAQKWLKDRIGVNLSFEDILHYQKIIKALAETNRLMREIDTIKIE